MNDIQKLIEELKRELAALQESLNDYRGMLYWDPKAPELKAEIALWEREEAYLKEFIRDLETVEMDEVRKEVKRLPINQLQPNKEYNDTKDVLADYIQGLNQKIILDITLESNAFDQAKLLVDGIDIQIKTPGGIKGYIINKTIEKGKDHLLRLFPYGSQILEIAKLFVPDHSIQAPELEPHIIAAIQDRIIDNASGQFAYTTALQKFLKDWMEQLYNHNKKSDQEKVIALRLIRNWLVDQKLDNNEQDKFQDIFKQWKMAAIQELFTIADVTITQVCEVGDFNEVLRDQVDYTQFSTDNDTNQNILAGLVDCGIQVSSGAISTADLQEYFPKCTLQFIAKGPSDLDEQIKNNYHHQSPGSTYAQARARARQREAEERAERRKKLEYQKNRRYKSVY